MPAPSDADLRDVLRALAIIRGHEERLSPDLVYSRILSTYVEYRVRAVEHPSAMKVIAKHLADRYPTAPALVDPALVG